MCGVFVVVVEIVEDPTHTETARASGVRDRGGAEGGDLGGDTAMGRECR